MRIDHSSCVKHVPPFGRKGVAVTIAAAPRSSRAEDVRLFALTFVAGFLFMTVYLA